MKRRTAVPEAVSCAVPIRWMSVQAGAAASQKFMTPGVTGDAPASVVAVSVTTVPGATEVTGLPAAVMARVVVVVEFTAGVMVTGTVLQVLLAYVESPL